MLAKSILRHHTECTQCYFAVQGLAQQQHEMGNPEAYPSNRAQDPPKKTVVLGDIPRQSELKPQGQDRLENGLKLVGDRTGVPKPESSLETKSLGNRTGHSTNWYEGSSTLSRTGIVTHEIGQGNAAPHATARS